MKINDETITVVEGVSDSDSGAGSGWSSGKALNIAIIHELAGAGAARCARDLERGLSERHEVRFFPRDHSDNAERILDELRADPPDVVHCHSFYGNLPYPFLSRVARRYPTCLTVHDPRPIGTIATECWHCERNAWCLRCPLVRPGRLGKLTKVVGNPYFRQRIRKRITHRRCPSSFRVVAPSRWMQGRLSAQELRRFEIRHIPYGLDLDRYAPRPADEARAQLGLPTGVPIVLHTGFREGLEPTYNRRKGLKYLAEAFETVVAPTFPDAVLAIVGENVIPNQPWARPLGVRPPEQIPSLLAAADVFVLCTLADNLPYGVLEAMACGRSVVASAVGGVNELVDHRRTGLLVPPANPGAIGEALVELIGDDQVRGEMGAAARDFVERHHRMGRFIEAYESLYYSMVGVA